MIHSLDAEYGAPHSFHGILKMAFFMSKLVKFGLKYLGFPFFAEKMAKKVPKNVRRIFSRYYDMESP